MRSYRMARRSFLASVGGAIGLRVMFGNLVALAEGAGSPPRFLITHWPVGTLRHRFLPMGSGASYVASPIIQPFIDAGLRDDMSVFYGFSDSHLRCPGGGGHEAGTPFTTTCSSAAGTRQNGGEGDDGVAGGPSFDQIFLKHVPELQRPGQGYVNALCDARVDSNETSTQCLSYSYTTRSIAAANPRGNITEYTPLLPRLGPVQLYADLFSNFMPGGSTPANQETAAKALLMRKSVLDFSLGELNELKRLSPGSEAPKIDLHAEAIRKIEQQLSAQIEGGMLPTDAPTCMVPVAPASNLTGKKGNAPGYGSEQTQSDDSPTHEQVAKAHAGILLAAFQCDLIRVATFQFSPGTNHVSFKGMWPSDPSKSFMHHPVSHMSPFLGNAASQPPPSGGQPLDMYEFLCSVQTWYNARLASILQTFKSTTDAFGNSLLDYTVIPYVTEVAESSHTRSPKAGFLFGGSKLGLKHGTFQNFSPTRPQADLYLTCAQALMQTEDPKAALADEKFISSNPESAPIEGLWSKA